MVFAAQALLRFPDVARRDVVLVALLTHVIGRSRFGADVIEAIADKDGVPSIRMELRFTVPADQIDMSDFVQITASGVQTPESGSWLSIHDCSHDGAPQPCIATIVRTW